MLFLLNMKIKSVQAIPIFFKLFSPFIFSGVKLEILDYVLVRVETKDGCVGYGECPAYWIPRRETQQSTLKAIEVVAKKFKGHSCYETAERLKIFHEHIPSAYAAQCGIDIACYDLVGKILNKPIAQILGIPKPVPVEVGIPMMENNDAIRIVDQALSHGISVFKVKVGKNLDKEINLLKLIKSRIGKEMKLFVDANQGFKTIDEVINFLKRLSEFDIIISWIEQPLPVSASISDFKKLRKNISIPIMLDESVYTYEDAEKFAKEGACDMFNIKLAKAGGISGAVLFFEVAKKYHIPCALGSMIEGALGTYAGLHFAATHEMKITALSAFKYINDELAFGPKIENGLMVISEKPGLGIEDYSVFESRFK